MTNNIDVELCTDPDCGRRIPGTQHGHCTPTEVGPGLVTLRVTDGMARTAAARAARTGKKHDRWMRELAGAGWTCVRAGGVTIAPTNDECLRAWCARCGERIGEWDGFRTPEVPLPQVLHAVSSHVCEVKP